MASLSSARRKPQPWFWQQCGPWRAWSLRHHHNSGAAVAAEAPNHLPSPPTPPPPPWRLAMYLESSARVGMHGCVTCTCSRTHVGDKCDARPHCETNTLGFMWRQIMNFPFFSFRNRTLNSLLLHFFIEIKFWKTQKVFKVFYSKQLPKALVKGKHN